MDFVAKQLKKAESLLEQVDATAGELSAGGGVLADDLEARLAQALATVDTERAERERREEEFTARIRSLEGAAKQAAALEREVAALTRALQEAKELHETAELQALVDAARAEAQSARRALADAHRDSAARLAELEQANAALSMELRSRFADAPGQQGALDRALEAARQERDEQLLVAETRAAAALGALKQERERGDRLELEVKRGLADAAELRAALERQRATSDDACASLRRELGAAQAQLQAARRSDEAATAAALQERLQSLSLHVEAKQRQVDALRSDRSALEQRLQEALAQRARPDAPAARRSVRLRPITSHRGLEKMLEAADSFTLGAGAALRVMPAARVALLAYACFLHTLAIVLLLFFARGGGGGGGGLRLRGAA